MNANSLLERFKTPTPEPKEGRDEAHDRHPCWAVRLVMESGDEFSVLYGSFIGSPAYNPSKGISFVFEALHPVGGKWVDAAWIVTITGSNLEVIYQHLCLSKQRFIRIGDMYDPGVGDVPNQTDPESPVVTAIKVEKLKADKGVT